MTRFQVPKQAINFIVDKYHVSTSDDAIRADIRKRCATRHGFNGPTQKQIERMETYAVKRHNDNRALYARVMGATL